MSHLTTHTTIRIARPSGDLAPARAFYVDGLGLSVLYEDRTHDAFAEIIMVGIPGARWHLELTNARIHQVVPAPTAEDLLVLYLGAPADPDLIERLRTHGGTIVEALNPYWERWGVTIADPDGYRLVLCERQWTA